MNAYMTHQKIIDRINSVKEFNQEVGNILHEQFNRFCDADYSESEMEDIVYQNDALDAQDEMDEDSEIIRDLQRDIINFWVQS